MASIVAAPLDKTTTPSTQDESGRPCYAASTLDWVKRESVLFFQEMIYVPHQLRLEWRYNFDGGRARLEIK